MNEAASASISKLDEATIDAAVPYESSTLEVDSAARHAIDELSSRIQELIDTADAPELLKRLFCHSLDWQYINQPVPLDALPAADRSLVAEASVLAQHEDLRLCYVRLSRSELLVKDQHSPLSKLTKAWPTVLVAFSNFGQKQIDFCHRSLDGRINRFSLDRSLFGAAELAQAIYAMRAFDVKTDEPIPRLETVERLERQFKRLPRRLRRPRRGLDDSPFWRELPRHQLLAHCEEQRLRRQYAARTKSSARDKLILCNLRLVVWVACWYRHRGVPFDDLIQEGVCGLMCAADRYDPGRGFRFSTYATWWVRQFIGRFVDERAYLVGAPAHFSRIVRSYRRLVRDHRHYFGTRPTDEEVQDFFRLTDGQHRLLRQAISASSRPGALPDSIGASEPSPGSEAAQRERLQAVQKVIDSRLDRRQKRILTRRFGLDGKPPSTLEELGLKLKLTRERVRQIEAKALDILKHPAQAKRLELHVS